MFDKRKARPVCSYFAPFASTVDESALGDRSDAAGLRGGEGACLPRELLDEVSEGLWIDARLAERGENGQGLAV